MRHSACMAAAKPTKRVAKGNVNIQGKMGGRWNLFQPIPVRLLIDPRMKMWRRRIARIPRQIYGKQFNPIEQMLRPFWTFAAIASIPSCLLI